MTKLKMARLKKEISQIKLAKLLCTTSTYISFYERGLLEVPNKLRPKIARILKTKERELFD